MDRNQYKNYYTPKQIQKILLDPDIRARDNSELFKTACLLIKYPDDIYLQEYFAYLYSRQQEKFTVSQDAYWSNYPPLGKFVLLKWMTQFGFLPTGDPVVLADEKIFSGIGVYGRTGASKSSLIRIPIIQWAQTEKDYLVIVFQSKDEFADLATLPELKGRVLPLRAKETLISIFQEPKGVDKITHNNSMLDNVGKSFQRLYAHRLSHNIFMELLNNLPDGNYPTLSELIKAHEQFRPGRGSVEQNYKESMLHTWREIHNSFGDIFDVRSSNFFEQLSKWSGLVTIQIDAPSDSFSFYTLLFVYYFYLKRKSIGFDFSKERPVIFVFEDITKIIVENSQSESPLASIAFMARQYKIGLIFCAHTLSVCQTLMANLETKFVLGLSDQELRRIQRLLHCTAEQANVIPSLQPGEAVADIPSMWPKSLYFRFPYITPPRKLTEPERLALARPFLDSVTVVRYSGQNNSTSVSAGQNTPAQKSNPLLDSKEIKLLSLAGIDKTQHLCVIYASMGLSRRDGRKTVERLIKKGMIKVYTIPTGKVGGQVSFIEILDHGWDILIANGFKKPSPVTKGGFLHNLAAKLITTSEKMLKRVVNYEVDINGRRMDMSTLDNKTGKRRYYNIGISDYNREAENLNEIIKLPALTSAAGELVFVGIDRNFVNKVQEVLKKKGWSKADLTMVEWHIVGEFVSN